MPPETAEPPEGSPRPKGVLFCPDCGHESPPDGDWRVQAHPDGDALTCPVCRVTVTVRPASAERSHVPASPPCGLVWLVRSARLVAAWTRACVPDEAVTLSTHRLASHH